MEGWTWTQAHSFLYALESYSPLNTGPYPDQLPCVFAEFKI